MHPRPEHKHHEPEQEPHSHFLLTWDFANQHVPFPYLYWFLFRPPEGVETAELRDLTRAYFVYRITNDFSVHLERPHHEFHRGALHRENYSYRLMPVQGHQGIMTPEHAESLLLRHLDRQHHSFWHGYWDQIPPEFAEYDCPAHCRHHRSVPWHSLKFEQPFRAGVIEPFYIFRKTRARQEFWIGARTGNIRCEPFM